MEQRYTTKKYDQTKKIDTQKIEELKEILRLSPSSINSQPWKFTFVSSEKTRTELASLSWHNSEKVVNCDTVVVLSSIDNLALFEAQIEAELPKGAVDYYKQFIKPKSAEEIKIWFAKQVYLALGVFLSACAEMGIDATPMEGIEPLKYDQVLNQTDYTTLVAVAIGYRDENDANQPSLKAKSRKALHVVVESL